MESDAKVVTPRKLCHQDYFWNARLRSLFAALASDTCGSGHISDDGARVLHVRTYRAI